MSGPPRFELPDDLTPQQERAVLAALERYFSEEKEDAWVLAGRLENVRLGLLQARRHTPHAWTDSRFFPFARRGTTHLRGRGDAR